VYHPALTRQPPTAGSRLDVVRGRTHLPRLARPDEASSCLGATPWASRELASSDVYTFLATTV
jgi:hypothetical protein